MFLFNKHKKVEISKKYEIMEELDWRPTYHLSEKDSGKTLCGIDAIPSLASITNWGSSQYFGEKFCKKCNDLSYNNHTILLNEKTNK